MEFFFVIDFVNRTRVNPYRLVKTVCEVVTVCDTWDDTKLLGEEFFPREYKRLRQFLYTLGFPIFMRGLDYITILLLKEPTVSGFTNPTLIR